MFVNILGKDVPLYGIFFYMGIFSAALVAVLISKRKRVEKFDIVGSGIYTMIGAMLGSKLLFILVSWQDIIEYKIVYNVAWSDMLMSVIKGGFVFYGGLIGGLLGLIVYIRQFKMKFCDLADIYATVLPFGHAFGRVGCFFGGCCYGIEYDGIFSHTYTSATGATPIGVSLLPVQLIEAACLLILFAVLTVIFFRCGKAYTCVAVYAVSYSVIRFILEFFRGDVERGMLLRLSTSQWISIAILLTVIIKWCYSRVKNKEIN